MEKIELHLKAKHFKGTDFCMGDCAIEKAVHDQLNQTRLYVTEMVKVTEIAGTSYLHERYGLEEFYKDKEDAKAANFDDTVIRTITLIEIKKVTTCHN